MAQSKAISVMNKDIKLPGLGSYKASAVERGDDQVAAVATIYFRLACFQIRQRSSSLAIKGEKIKKQATAS